MYPTSEEVEQATRYQLASWTRFLPSPGSRVIGQENFYEIMENEAKIMDKICERFKRMGGMTPEISKSLGW